MTLPADSFVQALAEVQQTSKRTHDAAQALLKTVQPGHEPSDARTVKLTASDPIDDSVTKKSARSFTVVNPYSITILVGFGGISSTNEAAFPLPPKSAVTFPIRAESIELGAAATDLAAGDAFVFVFLYDAPQPFFFAEWAG